ncbi:MAG: OB-fold-containig protein [Verrucomicrobiota bacterium]
MNWLLAPHNTVFAAAFVVLLCFALLEGVSLVLGLGLSDWLSDLMDLPHAGDADVHTGGHGAAPEAHADAGQGHGHGSGDSGSDAETGFFTPLLSWLEIGKVPVLISLCAFLAAFSIGGMILQESLILARLPALPGAWAAAAAFFPALPLLKLANRALGRVWPKDETSAFPVEHLVGWVGVVTIGTATEDRAAEVRVTGPDGRAHYVMCRVSGDPVPQGGEVLLRGRDPVTGCFRGVRNTNPDLSPNLYS